MFKKGKQILDAFGDALNRNNTKRLLLYRHGCFTGKYTTNKIPNCIRDLSGKYFISSLVKISMTSLTDFSRLFVFGWLFDYITKRTLQVSLKI